MKLRRNICLSLSEEESKQLESLEVLGWKQIGIFSLGLRETKNHKPNNKGGANEHQKS